MSDIHGDKDAFHSILRQIGLKSDDSLYILGDILDRHEYGVGILKTVMQMDNVKCLLGNHEQLCLNTIVPHRESLPWIRNDTDRDLVEWLRNGGKATLKALQKLRPEERESVIHYLTALPTEYDIQVNGKKYKLVHASPGELFSRDSRTQYHDEITFSVWNRIKDFSLLTGDYTLVFGHTPTSAFQNTFPLKIWYSEKAIGIDCGCGFDSRPGEYPGCGRLACLRLEDRKEFYSNGQCRYNT